MSNVLICHTNRSDASTLSNGSWVSTSTISLNNLKDGNIDKVARSSNLLTTSTRFAADLGANYTLRAVALIRSNLTPASATWRVKLGTAAPDTSNVFTTGQVLDSGALNVKQMTLAWDTPTDWGKQYPVMFVFDAVAARYVTVDITDSSNADGYVQIGRLFVGTGFQPAINPVYGLQDGQNDLSTFVTSRSGKKYFEEITPKQRWVDFTLKNLTLAEGDQVHEMQALCGLSKELLYVPDPADAALSQRYGMLALARELSPLEYPFLSRRAKAFRLEQKM